MEEATIQERTPEEVTLQSWQQSAEPETVAETKSEPIVLEKKEKIDEQDFKLWFWIENKMFTQSFVAAINKLMQAPLNPVLAFSLRMQNKAIQDQFNSYKEEQMKIFKKYWVQQENWDIKIEDKEKLEQADKEFEALWALEHFYEMERINIDIEKDLFKDDKPIVEMSWVDFQALEPIINFYITRDKDVWQK